MEFWEVLRVWGFYRSRIVRDRCTLCDEVQKKLPYQVPVFPYEGDLDVIASVVVLIAP